MKTDTFLFTINNLLGRWGNRLNLMTLLKSITGNCTVIFMFNTL
jgi:hypothetical protein